MNYSAQNIVVFAVVVNLMIVTAQAQVDSSAKPYVVKEESRSVSTPFPSFESMHAHYEEQFGKIEGFGRSRIVRPEKERRQAGSIAQWLRS